MPVTFIRSALLSIGIVIVFLSFGQKNMQQGFIVNNSGDTLNGFIDYRNWEKNPDEIVFSRSINGTENIFLPTNIRSFEVGNEKYESSPVRIDRSPYKIEDLSLEVKYNYVMDTVFLQNLVKGEKSLYFYKDSDGKEYFFISNGKAFDLLSYKRYLKYDDNGNACLAEDKRYIGQLNLFLNDCSSIRNKLQGTKYEKKALVNLFSYYYTCSNKVISSQDNSDSKPYEFGFFAGLSLTRFGYTDGPLYLKTVDYPSSAALTAGVFYNWVFPRYFGRLSITNELQYSSFRTEATYTDPSMTAFSRIGMHYIEMNNMFQYKYPVKKLFVFINAGFSTGFGFSPTNYKKQESSFQGISEGAALENLNRAYLGLPAGIGLKYQHYSFEIRYRAGFKKQDDLNGASHPFSNTNDMFFLLAYQF
jgi:hypothetical protein